MRTTSCLRIQPFFFFFFYKPSCIYKAPRSECAHRKVYFDLFFKVTTSYTIIILPIAEKKRKWFPSPSLRSSLLLLLLSPPVVIKNLRSLLLVRMIFLIRLRIKMQLPSSGKRLSTKQEPVLSGNTLDSTSGPPASRETGDGLLRPETKQITPGQKMF